MDSEIKVYRDTFKKDISFWIYVTIRYENFCVTFSLPPGVGGWLRLLLVALPGLFCLPFFHRSVIVDNMKEDCVLLEKLRKLQRVVHVLSALCILGFKKNGKVRKLERYITQRLNSNMGIDIPTYRIRIGSFGPGRGYITTGIADICSSSITGSDIHHRRLATMVLLTFLVKCFVMTQQEGIMQDVYTFAGTDQCQLPEHDTYSYISKSTY